MARRGIATTLDDDDRLRAAEQSIEHRMARSLELWRRQAALYAEAHGLTLAEARCILRENASIGRRTTRDD